MGKTHHIGTMVGGSEVASFGSFVGPMSQDHAEVCADDMIYQFRRLQEENPRAQKAEAAIRRAHKIAPAFALLALLFTACAVEGAGLQEQDADVTAVLNVPPARGAAPIEQADDTATTLDVQQAPDTSAIVAEAGRYDAGTMPEAAAIQPDTQRNGPEAAPPDLRPVTHDPNCANQETRGTGVYTNEACADWPLFGLCTSIYAKQKGYCQLSCGFCTP